jgi:hypothetical protein
MLVVLASAHDEVAQAMVAAWAPWRAVLCAPADLCLPGWSLSVSAPEGANALLAGRVTPAAEITGVLTRLLHIPPAELKHIATSERSYVATEMTAFLTAFLTGLRCVTLNRPSASALSGPGWRKEQWIRVAAKAGIPVAPVQRMVRPGAAAASAPSIAAEVTVVGGKAFGAPDQHLADWARELAASAGAGLLGVQFERQGRGYAFADVNPWPALAFPRAFDAVRELLMSRQ